MIMGGETTMKKFVSLLLVMILVFSLAACTKKTEEPTPAPEVVAGLKGTISVQVETGWMTYYQAAADRLKVNNPDAVIEFIETGAFDHLNVLDATDVTNVDVADVFAIPADRVYGLAQNEALAAIDAKAMAEVVGGFSNYDEGLGGNFMVNEEYMAFPMNIETLINFVNTANAKASGIDLTKPIEFTTLDPEAMLVPVFNAWFGVAMTNSAGIELLAHDASGVLYSDLTKNFADLEPAKQDVFKALFAYWQAHNKAGTPLWDNTSAWGYMDTSFTTGGPTAIRLEGPWSTGSLSAFAGNGADLGILPIGQVTLNGNPLTHWQGGWGLAINSRVEADADKMMLAQAFIEEIVNTEFAVDFFKATGKILENVDVSVYEASDLSAVEKTVISAVIESYNSAPARPLFIEWGQVWDTWLNSLLSWSAVKPATVEDAYAEVQAAFTAMMKNF
jgi:arabinogalactan oligomer/maltooligosaccharide transport system substrate-binding protein